jgi:hypothetical protein
MTLTEKLFSAKWLDELGDTLYVDEDLPDGVELSLWVKQTKSGWKWFVGVDCPDGEHMSADGDAATVDSAKRRSVLAVKALLEVCEVAHEVD